MTLFVILHTLSSSQEFSQIADWLNKRIPFLHHQLLVEIITFFVGYFGDKMWYSSFFLSFCRFQNLEAVASENYQISQKLKQVETIFLPFTCESEFFHTHFFNQMNCRSSFLVHLNVLWFFSYGSLQRKEWNWSLYWITVTRKHRYSNLSQRYVLVEDIVLRYVFSEKLDRSVLNAFWKLRKQSFR